MQGGNSGGPVINFDGELVGILFAGTSFHHNSLCLPSESLRVLAVGKRATTKSASVPLPLELADGSAGSALYTFGYAMWLRDVMGERVEADKFFNRVIAAAVAAGGGAAIYGTLAKLWKAGSLSQAEKERAIREFDRIESKVLREVAPKERGAFRKLFSKLRRFVRFL